MEKSHTLKQYSGTSNFALVICVIEHRRKFEALLQAVSVIYACLPLLRNLKITSPFDVRNS